jgi:AcrR family transcriptional regulator
MEKVKQLSQMADDLDTNTGDAVDVTPKRLGRRTSEESQETKQSLLVAAAAAFAERGLNGEKLDDIARRAGVTKGAIYSHFDGREDLLVKACRSAIRSLHVFEFAAEAPDLPTFVKETVDALMAPENKAARMLTIEVHLSATRSELMADLLAEWHAESLETLRDRASQGAVSPEAAMLIIHVLLLGLSHIDAFEAVGSDREEVLKIADRLTQSVIEEITQ